ncbi:MAG: fused MFS/spermidine synthase [Patescibacteria group bacterium]
MIATRDLYLASFLSNAVILVFEISGGRLLAPYIGTSVEVWAGLIAVILGSMAVGYHFGGRLADRIATRAIISFFFFAAGVSALTAWGMRDLVPTTFLSVDFARTLEALFIGGIIFAPTVAALAAISPLVAKNLITGLDRSARVVGTLNAVGTVGSIAGAIATGILLIPLFGVGEILLGTAISLVLFSLYLSRSDVGIKAAVLIAFVTTSFMLNAMPTRASIA